MQAAHQPVGLALAAQLARASPQLGAASTGVALAAAGAAVSCVVAPSTAGLASCDAWTAPTWTDKPDKTYTVEVKSVQSVFTPRNIIWTGLRCALMALVPVVERYLVALEEATELENRGEQPPPVPFPDLEPVRKRAQASMARDLSVQLCRRTLEHVLFVTQPPRTAAKLLKDISKSARRKALRPQFLKLPAWRRAEAMARTAMRAYIVVTGGEFIVQQSIVTSLAVRRAVGWNRGAQLRLWVRQTTQNVARAAACAAGASAGAAAVALVLPRDHPRVAQYATLLALVLGDVAGSAVVQTMTDAWVADAKAMADGGAV